MYFELFIYFHEEFENFLKKFYAGSLLISHGQLGSNKNKIFKFNLTLHSTDMCAYRAALGIFLMVGIDRFFHEKLKDIKINSKNFKF